MEGGDVRDGGRGDVRDGVGGDVGVGGGGDVEEGVVAEPSHYQTSPARILT